MQTTGLVFAFVVVMALFLWLTDKSLEWVLYDLVLGWRKHEHALVRGTRLFRLREERAARPHRAYSAPGDAGAFGRILVPVEEVVELKMGQKSISERKFFPGYVLVEMEMNDDSWHLVKSTPKVTGFVGGTANKPTPISEKEVAKDHAADAGGRRQAAPQGSFRAGRGRSRQGRPVHRFPWRRRAGQLRKEPLRVSVTIFGRPTPVELEFGQVEKA
jgi:transcriptional antiterminator NusG